jgi:hypothetical protein
MQTSFTLPAGAFEQANMLKDILTARVNGAPADAHAYAQLRGALLRNSFTAALVPDVVVASHELADFWRTISDRFGPKDLKRKFVSDAFAPLLARLERTDRAPSAIIAADAITVLDSQHVAKTWERALARCSSEPESALTSARELLESVCKHILEDLSVPHDPNADLPRLWGLCAQQLDLAPSQHAHAPLKTILGNCQSIVQNIGAVRNRLGDAHGKGRAKARAEERHATLAVTLAGAMSTFLLDTYKATKTTTS